MVAISGRAPVPLEFGDDDYFLEEGATRRMIVVIRVGVRP